jgi:hypothetical protein
VFLDFDGVLNSHEYVRSERITEAEKGNVVGLDPVLVGRLNRLLSETSTEVVVTSVKRHQRTRLQLYRMLSARGFTGIVAGMTPWLNQSHARGIEIQSWLDTWSPHLGPIESFVILDDDSDMNHLLPRLVKTSFATGLTDSDVDQAILMLT